MQKPHWKEFDFKIASDYTHGSPEYYRSKLRKMIGLPDLLPGEKNGKTSQRKHNKGNSTKTPSRRDM